MYINMYLTQNSLLDFKISNGTLWLKKYLKMFFIK